MATSSKKRTLDAFFTPASKKRSLSQPSQNVVDSKDAVPSDEDEEPATFSTHFTYPFPLQDLPKLLKDGIETLQSETSASPKPKVISNQPDLDLLYFAPFIPRSLSQDLFLSLRSSLPFYRVSYTIQRGPTPTNIVTPRFTTVFGLDATSRFSEDGDPYHSHPVDAETRTVVRKEAEYTTIPPRPIPQCLEALRRVVEKSTGERYNFVLVNYYASGSDSVAYHSDDERFLGKDPAIASLSLGAKRDFMLKHKPDKYGKAVAGTEVIKMSLGSGDMVLMRGRTQGSWLHAIPKRAGAAKEDGGRINITFRKALVKGGTLNYVTYNIGTGSVYRWDENRREMRIWEDKSNKEVKYHRGPLGVPLKTESVAKAEDDEGVKVAEKKMEMEKAIIEAKEEEEGEVKTGKMIGEDAEYMAADEDEAWEEKVRREIEGEVG